MAISIFKNIKIKDFFEYQTTLIEDKELIEFKAKYTDTKNSEIEIDSFDKKNEINQFNYHSDTTIERYDNFLSWLFETFQTSSEEFRSELTSGIQINGNEKILVTGCGLGDEVRHFSNMIGDNGHVHGQDLSYQMVEEAIKRDNYTNTSYSVSNAMNLPFCDDQFDIVFHFGGINLFPSISQSIKEMNRVCKEDGQIIFGDEGIGDWLLDTEYGKAMITNNSLWQAKLPINYLPENAKDVSIRWVLGNCFYLIKFLKSTSPFNKVNLNVKHKGLRGGSINTRYFGNIDGIDPCLREKLCNKAKEEKISITEILEKLIKKL